MVRNSPYQIVLREFTVLTVLQRLHGDFPETLQRHHRDSTETLRRYYRDSTEILHGLYRDSAETPHRLCRDSIETPQKLHRDSAETPEILQRLQRFYRDSLETLTESCNGSTTKLLGSVAGIIFDSHISHNILDLGDLMDSGSLECHLVTGCDSTAYSGWRRMPCVPKIP